MKYDFNGKMLNIPDKEIEKTMRLLDVDKEEAIEIWLEDEGYLDNEEQEELCQKAKDNRITATIHQAQANPTKKTKKETVRKENPIKEMVIQKTFEMLQEIAENVEILNKGKLISFKIGENDYTFDLVEKRKPKKGAK